jgi:hypothetical protein
VSLLQEYFTGKPIRFLRVDNAKEFTCPAMVDLDNANNIILQVVVSYNHLMQALVEGAIGICKQHTRVALAVAHMFQLVSGQPLSRIFGTIEFLNGPQQALREKSQRLMQDDSYQKKYRSRSSGSV